MAIRVGLQLETVEAVIHRVDVAGTSSFDPPGTQTDGYDPDLKEPRVFDTASGVREDARQELTPIRVPCQVEITDFERLQQLFPGNAGISRIAVVFSRIELEALGLLDLSTRQVQIGINDRVATIERRGFPGQIVQPLQSPKGLYIFELQPRSWGFGPDGHDLEIAFLSDRPRAA